MMSFQSNWASNASKKTLDRAIDYYTSGLSPEDKPKAIEFLEAVTNKSRAKSKDLPFLGPVIDYYPTWHPFVREFSNSRGVFDIRGDHQLSFANGMIFCPYTEDEVKDIEQSVADLKAKYQRSLDEERKSVLHSDNKRNDFYLLQVERLDVTLYHERTIPVAVWIEWPVTTPHGQIPVNVALNRLLREQLEAGLALDESSCAETWKTMATYFLGEPFATNRKGQPEESIFLDKETTSAIRNVWESLIDSGVFGPIYTGPFIPLSRK